jgi:hypothetical protein
MAFTGKATYSAGATLPELAEDVSDLIGIVSPYETPLLDALGDPLREAMSIHHEWLEDALLPNKDAINDSTYSDAEADTTFVVDHASYFRVGDQIQIEGSRELMLVTVVTTGTNTLTVVRGYGSTVAGELANDKVVNILGNAALEGADAAAARFTNRLRLGNYTQIFTESVQVSGSDVAAGQIGIADEMDFQKQERLRELLRSLESTIINGGKVAASPEGSDTVRRTMKGIIPFITSHKYAVGSTGLPAGTLLLEGHINIILRRIWEQSNGHCDLIVCGGGQKRAINGFLTSHRSTQQEAEKYKDLINVYESDFGICRVVTTRWVPQDVVLFLDSSKISVMPLAGRSFHFKPLASAGDYELGEIIGEYTLEFKNESAHGMLTGLTVAT